MPLLLTPSRPHLLNVADTFIPRLIATLKQLPNHPTLARLTANVPAATLIAAYDKLPAARRRRLYGAAFANATALPAAQLDAFILTTMQRRASAIRIEQRQQRRRVGEEYNRLRTLSLAELQATRVTSATSRLALLIALSQRTHEDECCTPPDTQPPDDPPPLVRYGFKLNRLKCVAQEDWLGDDESYMISVAVDGEGNLIAQQSPRWKMDAGQARNPSWYIYPPRVCGNFLDISVALLEDDGGYAEVGRSIRAIGSVVGEIGGALANPYVAIAGGVISIAGDIVSLSSDLDDDDELGVANFTFESGEELATSVGTANRRYDRDGADYRATFQLLRP